MKIERDDTFTNTLVDGEGITAKLVCENNIADINEKDISKMLLSNK